MNIKKPSRSLTIGIITPEIIGPKHGGIGTAYSMLAETLAIAGHKVHILFVPSDSFSTSDHILWKEQYNLKYISLHILEEFVRTRDLTRSSQRSIGVWQWLEKSTIPFDVIHFPEWLGVGYHALLAHRQRRLFPSAVMVVGVHSSTRWLNTFNESRTIRHLGDLELFFIEEESIRLADAIVSPSQYYLDWLKTSGISFPDRCHVIPNLNPPFDIPVQRGKNTEGAEYSKESVKELVFFGRLETRKGIRLFCDALDLLSGSLPHLTVTFLGHPGEIDGVSSHSYILNRANKWSIPIKILSDYGRDRAIKYLSHHGRLAIIPSLAETLGYTVLECIESDIPFLASRVGGIPELICDGDRDKVLFSPNPESLACVLQNSLESGVSKILPAYQFSEIRDRWLRWHEESMNVVPVKSSSTPIPFKSSISIILVISYPSENWKPVLNALLQQEWDGEIALTAILPSGTLNTSEVEEIERFLNDRKIRTINLTSERSIEDLCIFLEKTRTNYFLLFSLPLVPVPRMVKTFIDIQKRHCNEILTSSIRVLRSSQEGEIILPFLGRSFPIGFLKNVFGEGVVFLTKNSVLKLKDKWYGIINGGPLGPIISSEALAGLSMATVPEPLFEVADIETKKALFSKLRAYRASKIEGQRILRRIEVQDMTIFMGDSAPFFAPSSEGSFILSPQGVVDEFWNSRSYIFARKVVGNGLRIFGRKELIKPCVDTLPEAIAAIYKIQSSPIGIFAGFISLINHIF